jgi:hypothetical protein
VAVPPSVPGVNSILKPAPIHELERRVRRMYLEALINRSEKVVYDERLDLKVAATSPVSQLAMLLTFACTTTLSVCSLVITLSYSAYFTYEVMNAWFDSMWKAVLFLGAGVETIKVMLKGLHELEQWHVRRRAKDAKQLASRVAAQRGAKLDNMHEQMVSRRLEAKAEARVTQIINLRRSVVQGIIDPNRVDTPDSSAGAAPPHPAAHAVQDTMQEVRHLAAKEVHLAAEAAQHAASGARSAALSAAAGIREAFQEVEHMEGDELGHMRKASDPTAFMGKRENTIAASPGKAENDGTPASSGPGPPRSPGAEEAAG